MRIGVITKQNNSYWIKIIFTHQRQITDLFDLFLSYGWLRTKNISCASHIKHLLYRVVINGAQNELTDHHHDSRHWFVAFKFSFEIIYTFFCFQIEIETTVFFYWNFIVVCFFPSHNFWNLMRRVIKETWKLMTNKWLVEKDPWVFNERRGNPQNWSQNNIIHKHSKIVAFIYSSNNKVNWK